MIPMDSGSNRRGFLGSAVAIACGAAALLVPTAVGIAAFLNPLRQKGKGGGFVRLGSLDVLPQDGTPLKVAIIADRTDAWTHFPAEPLGAVFLRRAGDRVVAFQVSCPHAGCSIGFEASPKGGRFFCPCHSAAFDLTGKRIDAVSPSPRDMDSLEVQVRNKTEVWVKFETFIAGTAGKTPQG